MTPAPDWGSGWPPPSRPLPADGIKARSRRGEIGETWWSRRFIAVLESLDLGTRLARGRSYARQGQVLDLSIHPGRVTANVQGSRPTPYKVVVAVDVLSETDWARAADAMAAKAVFLAKLLAGEMPLDIESAFADCSLSLFPARPADLETSCSCPDWANPCKHVAAVLYLLAESFDADPWLILAWRGRSKDALLAAFRTHRGAGAPSAWWEAEPTSSFWEAGPELAAVRPRPRPAVSAAAILRQADPIDLVVGGRPLLEVLTPFYDLVTAAAVEVRPAPGPG